MKKSFLFVLLFYCTSLTAQPIIVFTPVVSTGLSSPVDIVNAGDGTNRMFVVQQGGNIRLYNAGWTLLNSNFLTISTNISTGGERGLLSLVFHPNFENNRYFFVYYTNTQGGINVDRFQTDINNPNAADAGTRTNIMTIVKPVTFANHNGGKLNFGPDGHLYFGLGDGGSGGDPRNFAQRGDSLWGKMVRINVDNFTTTPYYTIPADNPYISDPNFLDQIYNTGLRNPWRWSFDRLNGNIWIADVGQNNREEVNYRTAAQTNGTNYGWRCYEGFAAYSTGGCLPQTSYTDPIFDYPHNNATGGFSITGGYVYRGSLYPALYGYYICSDYVNGNTWTINSTTFATNRQNGLQSSIAGFGETENGEIFAVANNTIFSVTTSSVLPLQLLSFNGYAQNNTHVLNWETANESGMSHFIIQYSSNGAQFTDAGRINAVNLPAHLYRFENSTISGRLFYRLQIHHRNGEVTYSKIISLQNAEYKDAHFVKYHAGSNRLIWIDDELVSGTTPATLRIYSGSGQIVHESRLQNQRPALINLRQLSAGFYVAELVSGKELKREKIVLR
jgi:glucose/arabinose dehydrogenase